jgi:AbrB family looped-hinge helix DNA binding protein
MSKVTSKLQVTIPKQVADQYGIRPGDDIEWLPAGETIRVVPGRGAVSTVPVEERLAFFDAATERQRQRQEQQPVAGTDQGRGWTREDLYTRGRAG